MLLMKMSDRMRNNCEGVNNLRLFTPKLLLRILSDIFIVSVKPPRGLRSGAAA